MRRVRPPRATLVVLLLLLAPALAGCLGGDDEEPAPSGPAVDPETPSTGTITVAVVDPGEVPVSEANVTLTTAAGEETKTTSVLGTARFDDVAPGNVTVRAEATGFLAASRSFELRAGQDAQPVLGLARAGKEAFVETFPFEGFFGCALTYLIITGECYALAQNVTNTLGQPFPLNDTSTQYIFDFEVHPGWTRVEITQEWSDPEFALGAMMRVNLEPYVADGTGHADRYARAEGTSPIAIELVPGELHENASADEMILPADGGHVQTRSFHLGLAETHNPGGTEFLGAGAAYQQRFTVLVEVHYEL